MGGRRRLPPDPGAAGDRADAPRGRGAVRDPGPASTGRAAGRDQGPDRVREPGPGRGPRLRQRRTARRPPPLGSTGRGGPGDGRAQRRAGPGRGDGARCRAPRPPSGGRTALRRRRLGAHRVRGQPGGAGDVAGRHLDPPDALPAHPGRPALEPRLAGRGDRARDQQPADVSPAQPRVPDDQGASGPTGGSRDVRGARRRAPDPSDRPGTHDLRAGGRRGATPGPSAGRPGGRDADGGARDPVARDAPVRARGADPVGRRQPRRPRAGVPQPAC